MQGRAVGQGREASGPTFGPDFQAEFLNLLAWRRDVRRFRPSEVPEALIGELVALTAFAPSVGNCQPTRFVNVVDADRRQRVVENFERANRRSARRLSRRTRARLCGPEARRSGRGARASGGILRRSDRTRARPRRAHHAGDTPLFRGMRVAHVLARRACPRPRRRLGVDPRSRRRFARRSTFPPPGPSSAISASAGRRRPTRLRNSSASAGRPASRRRSPPAETGA